MYICCYFLLLFMVDSFLLCKLMRFCPLKSNE
uniref:Uncharacterized protein n=1 Tax=Rhizophora mucronata TaxID=61149 RepID=A0A2P2MZQ4_RHIMU